MFDFKILPDNTAMLESDDCRYGVVASEMHLTVFVYVDGHFAGFYTTYYGWDVEEEEEWEYDDLSSEDVSWD